MALLFYFDSTTLARPEHSKQTTVDTTSLPDTNLHSIRQATPSSETAIMDTEQGHEGSKQCEKAVRRMQGMGNLSSAR